MMQNDGDRRPLTPGDAFRLAFLQDGQLSPDGAQVAYAVVRTQTESETPKDTAAIWLRRVDGGEERQLTSGQGKDTTPRWSPDGAQIAFISNRAGKNQLFVIAVDGGEARPLTAMPQGVGGSFDWSPDGAHIAFAAGPQGEPRKPEAGYRLTRHIIRFDGIGYVDDVAQDIYVVALAGGEPRRLTSDGCQNSNPQWSPAGGEILYTATLPPDQHRWRPMLRVVTLAGETRPVSDGFSGVSAAGWTADGRQIVFAGVPEGLPLGTQSKLWLVDKNGQGVECRSQSFTGNVGGSLIPDLTVPLPMFSRVLVSPDSRHAYLHAQVGGEVHVYRMALAGAEASAAIVSGERACMTLDLKAGLLLFSASHANSPLDLWVLDIASGQEKQVTDLNSAVLGGLALPQVERLQFYGTDGADIEGWLMKPPTGQAPYPCVLYIHGGPHAAYGHIFSFDFQMLAGAGYAVLYINHRASTGYGDAFATAIKGDWGNLDYGDLMCAVDYAIEKGLIDGERLGCCGVSGGGNLSCWIVGHTDRFKAAVPENPVTNWVSFYGCSDIGPEFAEEELGGKPHEIPEVYARCSPITYAHRCRTPTLMVQGETDYRCPAEQSEQFYTVLKANGCTVEMLRLPNAPHAGSRTGAPFLRRAQNEALLDWMNKWVLGKE